MVFVVVGIGGLCVFLVCFGLELVVYWFRVCRISKYLGFGYFDVMWILLWWVEVLVFVLGMLGGWCFRMLVCWLVLVCLRF